jgi:hypothetical protein
MVALALGKLQMSSFLGSIHGVHDLVFQILSKTEKKVSVHFAQEAHGLWVELNFHRKHFYINAWDLINIRRIIANEINFSDKIDSARFLAAHTVTVRIGTMN